MAIIRFILKSLMSLIAKATINVKRIHPELPEGNFVLVSNHRSHADLGSLMYGLGIGYDEIAPFAAKDYFFTKEKFTLRAMPKLIYPHLQPVSRFGKKPKPLSKVVKESGSLDSPGRKVFLVYPEGTRNPRSVFEQFKPGFAELAKSLDLPVVPVYISGSSSVLPKGSYIPTRSKVELNVGKAFKIDKTESIRAASNRTREKIQNLRSDHYYNKKLQEK